MKSWNVPKVKPVTEIQQYWCKLPANCLTPSSQKHELYHYVNWDIVYCCICIHKQCADNPFTAPKYVTNWTIEVVYPSREMFGPSGGNCMYETKIERFCRFNRSVLLLNDKTSIIRITWHLGAFMQPLYQWKSNNYHIF